MPPLKHRFLIALFAVGLLGLTSAALKVGEPFPDLAAFKPEGKLPADLKGKIVVVDFWASWCKPCKKSFPALNELQSKYAAQGVVIVGVNEDEKPANMEQFLAKNPATFAIVRDGEQKLVAQIGVKTMPSSFILDRTGKVHFIHSGFHGDDTKQQYMDEIDSLLKP